MAGIRKTVLNIFNELNNQISEENMRKIKSDEVGIIPRAQILILGQMSLLMNERVAANLTLAHTADLDAKIVMDNFVKRKLKELLQEHRLIYDEDSPLIWIPEDARIENLMSLSNLTVQSIDPESALVSKAVKAKEKNKQLIRQAIASNLFVNLAKRIVNFGGDLKYFA